MRLTALFISLAMCLTVVSFAQQTFIPPPPPPPPAAEAPTGFDNETNGMVDAITHQQDLAAFDAVAYLSWNTLTSAASTMRASSAATISTMRRMFAEVSVMTSALLD